MGRHHEDFGLRTYLPGKTCIVGLCLGSLVAATVASSHSLADLLPLALETVGIAFRVGWQTLETARHLHARTNNAESWSVVFGGMDKLLAQVALEDFNRDMVCNYFPIPYYQQAAFCVHKLY